MFSEKGKLFYKGSLQHENTVFPIIMIAENDLMVAHFIPLEVAQLSLLLERNHNEINKPDRDNNINDVPNESAQSKLDEWLEQYSKSCEGKAKTVFPRLEIVVREIGKCECCQKSHQRIESVGHIRQTEYQQYCYNEFDYRFHI